MKFQLHDKNSGTPTFWNRSPLSTLETILQYYEEHVYDLDPYQWWWSASPVKSFAIVAHWFPAVLLSVQMVSRCMSRI